MAVTITRGVLCFGECPVTMSPLPCLRCATNVMVEMSYDLRPQSLPDIVSVPAHGSLVLWPNVQLVMKPRTVPLYDHQACLEAWSPLFLCPNYDLAVRDKTLWYMHGHRKDLLCYWLPLFQLITNPIWFDQYPFQASNTNVCKKSQSFVFMLFCQKTLSCQCSVIK